MPKLKKPSISNNDIVNKEGVIISETDYGEFHPYMQCKCISDLSYNVEFIGIEYKKFISPLLALKFITMCDIVKPLQKDLIYRKFMSEKSSFDELEAI
jgi:hypothetical protein